MFVKGIRSSKSALYRLCDRLSKCKQIGAGGILHCRADGDSLLENGHIFEFIDECMHIFRAGRSPGTIFDQSDRAILHIECLHIVQQRQHRGINAVVVGRRGENDVTAPENLRDGFGDMNFGQVVDCGLCTPASASAQASRSAAFSVSPYMEP